MHSTENLDFIRQIVAADVANGTHGGRVLTRFPPEPNGFLHVGHASAICLDFGVAAEFGGRTTLRMDDTNPTTEDPAYVDAIARDIAWLGFEWDGAVRYASDYFEALYRLALRMIEDGFAYVDDHSEDQIRAHRGTVVEPGRPSPHRDRSIEENLDLFRRMRAGEFEDGSRVLRARIDLAAANMKMRDPLMYRIRHARHYRTGDAWPIYPMYDWAHGQSDAIEGITHSLCTLEFMDNRELYDWFIEHTRPAAAGLGEIPGAEGGGTDELGSWDPRPRQYEFARRNLDYTIVSKRKLLRLVEERRVAGWDDPRMPTLAGLRRRGVAPEAIRAFCAQVGIGKADNRVEIGTLEAVIRDTLNQSAPRVMCVLDPLRVVVENWAEGEAEWLEAPYFPHDIESPPDDWPAARRVPFTRTLYIERGDFREEPERGFRRLSPGREVRLRHAYFIECHGLVKDDDGNVIELRCTYDPDTRGGSAPDGRKPAGTIHWVSAESSLEAEVRLYDRLFEDPDPEIRDDFTESLNPESLIVKTAVIEPSVGEDPPHQSYQFERTGYFVRDRASRAVAGVARAQGLSVEDEGVERLVFNRTVELRDSRIVRAASGGVVLGDRADAVVVRGGASRDRESGPVGADTGRAARDAARAGAPALGEAFARLQSELGLPEDLADLLSGSAESLGFFEKAAAAAGADPVTVANWQIHEVRGAADGANGKGALEPGALGALVTLVEDGTVSRTVAKELLVRLIAEGGDPRAIVEAEGLGRIGDETEIRRIVTDAIALHPDKVARYRDGQTGLAGFFVGQVMRETEGRADPAIVKSLVEESLG